MQSIDFQYFSFLSSRPPWEDETQKEFHLEKLATAFRINACNSIASGI